MRLLCRRLARLSSAVVLVGVSLAVAAPSTTVHAAPAGASAYVPLSPNRILDTRIGLGFPRRIKVGETFHLAVTPAVPAEATAIVLNVTIDDSADAGFVTIFPTAIDRPTASSLNVDAAGGTIANLVTVPIGAGGSVDVFSQMETDLVADVQGYYVPAGAAQAGRFVPVNPTRLVDTREPSSPRFGALGPATAIDLDIATLGGLPADATAAALKVTVTESAASGFWTVYPAGTSPPTASNLNATGAGDTIANQVLARLNAGRITVFSQSGGHLVIDLVGWFTGPSSPTSDVGLFVPVSPSRLLDSRAAPLGARPGFNRTAEVPVANRFGVPAGGVGAVVVNATVTEAAAPGYFSVWPARTYRPNASSLNATHAGETIANHVITPVSTAGFAFYTQSGAHLVVDISGWYTGAELGTVLPPHVPLTGPGGPPPTLPFAFEKNNANGPLRWNPCETIPYLVNIGASDPSTRAVIAEAVERVEAATGLTLIPVGDTTFVPTSAKALPDGGATREIVIALSDAAHSDLVPGNVVGLTSISFLATIGAASVVIDMGDIGSRPAWSSSGLGPVLLHELGHAVGLGHVADNTQIMNPAATPTSPTTYAAGDLTGMWQLGSAAGCA